jgi:hypothetical protein
MASRRLLLRRQRSWARRAGLTVDASGYVPAVSANLRQALSPAALADFRARGAAEFHDSEKHAARMRAVHSSMALAVNVFDHWNRADPVPLAEALGVAGPVRRLVFEPHLPMGLAGNPASPDILVEFGDGGLMAIECKFSEWLVPKRQRGKVFRDRYFPPGPGAWCAAGLPACQVLADDLQSGREYCRYLDAAQLLKHTLGLSAGGSRWSLLYLYFDWPGSIQRSHRVELDRIGARVAGETGWRSMTYQSLVARLSASGAPVEQGYLGYLQARYLLDD